MKKLLNPYLKLVFPSVCACCGVSLEKDGQHICSWCREERFEFPGETQLEILPEYVGFMYSLWCFDKGGYLQDLLHNLKYNYLKTVGTELGKLLGKQFLMSSTYKEKLMQYEHIPILIPVPLHKSKKRMRGYNQARVLAEGMSSETRWEVVPSGIIQRIRKTKTQTGLNSEERVRNLRGAFVLNDSQKVEAYYPIIIDDVFTTGTTAFELASVIRSQAECKVGILTVAKA